MKKRIIASTMASVMAISSAATMLVSSAVEVKDVTKEHADKKDLQNLLEKPQIVELRDGGVDDYGSVASENFLRAIELATNLVESGSNKTQVADYTAAYQMVIAAAEKLIHYTKEQLKGLLDDTKDAYETNNFLNDHGDLKYSAGWDDFEQAWDEAKAVEDSDDLRETTDAYEKLEAAKNGLVEYKTVTKTEAKNARQAYEAIQSLEYKYQPWQRGTVEAEGDKLKGQGFAWGTLYTHVWSANTTLITVVKEFEDIKNYNVTSNKTIYDAVKAMERAVKVINSFKTSLDSGSSTNMKKLLSEYYGQLVYVYNADYAAAVVNSLLSDVAIINSLASDGTRTDGTASDAAARIKFKTSKGAFMDMDNIDGAGATATIDSASKADYWNAHTGTSYDRLVDASLEVQLETSAATDAFYITNPGNVLPNGKAAIYSPDDEQFFWHKEADARAAAKAAGIPESYVKCLRRSSTQSLKISDLIPVGADQVITKDSISITVDFGAALAAVNASIEEAAADDATLGDAVSTAKADATALKAAVAASSAGFAAIEDAADVVMAALASLEAAGGAAAASTEASMTIAGVTAVEKAYDKVEAALTSYLNEVNKMKNVINQQSGGAAKFTEMTTAVTTAAGDLRAFFGKKTTDFPALKTAFCGTYYEKAAADALLSTDLFSLKNDYNGDSTEVASNNIYEYNETISNPLSFRDFNNDEAFTKSGSNLIYASSRPIAGGDHKSSITCSNLDAALILYDAYKYNAWADAKLLDNQLMINANSLLSGAPNSNANKILYNYLKYSLEDNFLGSKSNGHTLKDVKDLIVKANELDDKTHEVSLFNVSRNAMIVDRTAAIDWVRQAEAQQSKSSANPYVDCVSIYTIDTRKTNPDTETLDSDTMWTRLNQSYGQLQKEYDGFLYSFGDVIDEMAKIAAAVDAGKYSEAAAKKITDALEMVALQMLALGDQNLLDEDGNEISDSSLFNGDGTINRNNRLFTYGKELDGLATELQENGNFVDIDILTTNNKAHDKLKTEYDKLVAAYADAQKELEKPKDELVYDIDGVNGVTVSDVMMLIDLVLAGNKETAKYDYDNSGSVGVSDVLILIDKAMGK